MAGWILVRLPLNMLLNMLLLLLNLLLLQERVPQGLGEVRSDVRTHEAGGRALEEHEVRASRAREALPLIESRGRGFFGGRDGCGLLLIGGGQVVAGRDAQGFAHAPRRRRPRRRCRFQRPSSWPPPRRLAGPRPCVFFSDLRQRSTASKGAVRGSCGRVAVFFFARSARWVENKSIGVWGGEDVTR